MVMMMMKPYLFQTEIRPKRDNQQSKDVAGAVAHIRFFLTNPTNPQSLRLFAI
jgi:hypothetical protein